MSSATNRSSPGRGIERRKGQRLDATSRATKRKKPRKKKQRKSSFDLVSEFVAMASTVRNDILIGIDPGQRGAIGMKCAKTYLTVDIPRIETKRKKVRRNSAKQRKVTGFKTRTVQSVDCEPDFAGIVAMFKLFKSVKHRLHVILENIPKTTGIGRAYADIMLNRAYAIWPLFITSKGYDFHQVAPKLWKAAIGLLGADKEQSRLLALKMYPEADIGRKKDHDRAESLLLVEYLRRKLTKRKKHDYG